MFWPWSTDKSHHRSSSPVGGIESVSFDKLVALSSLAPIHLKCVFMPLGKVTAAGDSGISENT